MLYLLDANVLIDANRDYYPLGRVPEFWEWLVDRASRHQVKIPLDMYEEILAGGEDDLTEPSQTIATCQGSANTNRLLPTLGRSSGVSRRLVPPPAPVLTATYWRPSTA